MTFTDDIKLGGDANSIRPAKQYKGTQRAQKYGVETTK